MKTINSVSYPLLAALICLGCGGAPAETEIAMTGLVSEAGTEVSALLAMVGSHKTTIDGAVDLIAVSTAEGTYKTMMAGHHDEIHHALGEMASCQQDDGTAPQTDDLGNELENLEAELATHVTNMMSPTDLSAAQTEETRHNTAITAIITKMTTHHGELESSASTYMCTEHDTDSGGSTGGH